MGYSVIQMVNNVTKKNISDNLSYQTGISNLQVQQMVDDTFSFIVDIVNDHGELTIPQFGKFKQRKKNKRFGRNPKTKEEYIINARNVLTFNCSDIFKEFINS